MGKGIGMQLFDNNTEGAIMDLKIVPQRDAAGKIVSGMVIGNTVEQNKALILLAQPGDYKFRIDLGVGLQDLALSEDYLYFRHRIREHSAKDGLVVRSLDLYAGTTFKMDADYGS